MSLIKGIHHFMLKCCGVEEFERTVDFYHNKLGLPIARSWGDGKESAIMLDTGAGYVEIFANGEESLPMGNIRHIALSTGDTDTCFKLCVEAGCKVITEPVDVCIPSNPPYPARIAFVNGPLGEEIELFQVK